ncbi:MAG: c-type cytochrome [Magnetococcales bacterium]|nr:c-type cytochrome [Magnetococcales bacterium]MBF0148430.1 c-type cytochrome [Magnetococcales bacterium]MBF0173055.1 c-type cytochrome [Magnetococcales bacterium]MBF0346320.1 c-type cytochrome [Magnetococcales bacterium]MBF0631714.1 c-type cytochrome [Magnetococcales bacterium]
MKMNIQMKFGQRIFRYFAMLILFAGAVSGSGTAHAVLGAETALEVLKRNDCTKCHGVKKSKNGPSYQKVSEKYRGKPDAENTLFKHLTTSPKVKLEDGTEEQHKKTDFETSEQLREFIRWILSL